MWAAATRWWEQSEQIHADQAPDLDRSIGEPVTLAGIESPIGRMARGEVCGKVLVDPTGS